LAAELRALPAEKRDVERRKRIEAWIDAGHGSCLMREPRIADVVQESLLSFDAQRYRLLAWVVMPNHVHVLFEPINVWTVAKIVASWKKFTARKICDMIVPFPGNANLPIGSGLAPQIESGASIWHREYWDRYIRNEQHLKRAIEYIHQNPVKASLVASPEAYRWSSAHFLRSPLGTPISRLAP
jgi:REP element-mobilizing transposase RayT